MLSELARYPGLGLCLMYFSVVLLSDDVLHCTCWNMDVAVGVIALSAVAFLQRIGRRLETVHSSEATFVACRFGSHAGALNCDLLN